MRQLYSFYTDAFWIALKSILEHKLRAFLTLIGIIIGVASVVVVGASISGLNSYVTDKVVEGARRQPFHDGAMAFSGRMDDEEFERRNRAQQKADMDEYEYIKANCANCSEVGAEMQCRHRPQGERRRNAVGAHQRRHGQHDRDRGKDDRARAALFRTTRSPAPQRSASSATT